MELQDLYHSRLLRCAHRKKCARLLAAALFRRAQRPKNGGFGARNPNFRRRPAGGER
jgi:hypothetical protein